MSIGRVHFLPAISPRGEDMVRGDLWHEIHSRRPRVYSRARQESRLLGPYRAFEFLGGVAHEKDREPRGYFAFLRVTAFRVSAMRYAQSSRWARVMRSARGTALK